MTRFALAAAVMAAAIMIDASKGMEIESSIFRDSPPARTSRKKLDLTDRERAWREKAAARNAIAPDSKD